MIKDVFVLKKDSWHSKLMKYIWNLDYTDFSHICPYFHLSWVNCILFLPVFLFKTILIKYVIKPILIKLDKLMIKYENIKIKKNNREYDFKKSQAEKIQSDPKLMQEYVLAIEKNYQLNTCLPKEFKGLSGFINIDWDKWDKKIQPLIASELSIQNRKQKEQGEKNKLEKEAKLRRKQKINNLIKWVKPIGKFIAIVGSVISAGFIIYGLFLGINWLYININLKEIKFVILMLLKIIFYLSMGSLGIIGLFKLYEWVYNKLEYLEIPCSWKKNIISFCKFTYKWFIYPFIWFFKGVGTIFTIIFQMIKNNCPAIKWE